MSIRVKCGAESEVYDIKPRLTDLDEARLEDETDEQECDTALVEGRLEDETAKQKGEFALAVARLEDETAEPECDFALVKARIQDRPFRSKRSQRGERYNAPPRKSQC